MTRRFSRQLLRAAFILAISVPPAMAQSALPLKLSTFQPTYAQLGQQLSFSFGIEYGIQPKICGFDHDDNPIFCNPDTPTPLGNATLTAQLPPGVSFLSVSQGAASVSGSGATGQQVTISLGSLQFSSHNPGLFLQDLLLLSAAGNADSLQAVFQISGTAADGSTAISALIPSLPFQIGLKPVGVFVEEYFAECSGPGDAISRTGVSLGGEATFGPTGGSESFNTDGLGVNPLLPGDFSKSVQIGTLVGAGSSVTLGGMGAEVSGSGGYGPTSDPSVPSFPFAPSSGNSSCRVDAVLQFGNPNPFPVALNVDDQTYGYAAASNGAAKDPLSGVVFGFPGGCGAVFDSDTTAAVNFLGAGGGIEDVTVFRRKLLTSTGTTTETQARQSCFEDAPASTCNNADFVQNEPGISDNGTQFPEPSPFAVGAGDSRNSGQPNVGSPNYLASFLTPQCGGSTNFARDADTGEVSLIRSGYGLSTVAQRVTVMMASDDPNTVEASIPTTLEIAGHSPVTLLVTDSNGHRVGLLPAGTPAPPATGQPKIDRHATIVSEIFGASYSGMNSSPQVISIPFPKPGNFQIQAIGTGAGSYSLTTRTLNVGGQAIDQQAQSGMASQGSADKFALNVNDSGHLTLTSSACAQNLSNSVSVRRSGYRYNFATARFVQSVAIVNSGADTVAGPILLALDGLSGNASLFNATGSTACAAPLGSAYLTVVPAGSTLGSGTSAAAVLQFNDPTKTGITYSTRVLAGTGKP